MPRTSDARGRAISTTARLLQEQGYGQTGVTQILAESGSPKGSFYFHFPDGKEQLAILALRAAGRDIADELSRLADTSATPARLVDRFIRAEARLLRESGYRQGCPIATVALEMASDSPGIQRVCQDVFASWMAVLAGHFTRHLGADAAGLAEHTVMCLEGALLLSRVQRSTAPLLRARDRLCAELERAGPPPGEPEPRPRP